MMNTGLGDIGGLSKEGPALIKAQGSKKLLLLWFTF
jgi:hypothetical protein